MKKPIRFWSVSNPETSIDVLRKNYIVFGEVDVEQSVSSKINTVVRWYIYSVTRLRIYYSQFTTSTAQQTHKSNRIVDSLQHQAHIITRPQSFECGKQIWFCRLGLAFNPDSHLIIGDSFVQGAQVTAKTLVENHSTD